MATMLDRLLRSLGGDGAVRNARAELVHDHELTVQAQLVVQRVNHTPAPVRARATSASAPTRRPSLARAA